MHRRALRLLLPLLGVTACAARPTGPIAGVPAPLAGCTSPPRAAVDFDEALPIDTLRGRYDVLFVATHGMVHRNAWVVGELRLHPPRAPADSLLARTWSAPLVGTMRVRLDSIAAVTARGDSGASGDRYAAFVPRLDRAWSVVFGMRGLDSGVLLRIRQVTDGGFRGTWGDGGAWAPEQEPQGYFCAVRASGA